MPSPAKSDKHDVHYITRCLTEVCLSQALARRLANANLTHAATMAWICANNVDAIVRQWRARLQAQGVSVDGLQVGVRV